MNYNSYSAETGALINKLLDKAIAANLLTLRRKTRQTASIRLTKAAIVMLLESPNGITPGELLGITESENLSPVVLKIRNYLKKDNLYTLVRYIQNKKPRYRIDPV
jgi:hypothetical protein